MEATFGEKVLHTENLAKPPAILKPGAEDAGRLALLEESSRELTAILDRDELLRRIAQRVKRLIDYDLLSVLLWNEETQLLEHVFSLRFDEQIELKAGLRLGQGLCGTSAVLRQPVRAANVHSDARYVQCSFGVGVRSELVVPLVFKDRVIGVLDLESTKYDAFTEQHERTLATLASYVAIALENARLYEQVRENERRLESELATAREIQRQLLPDRPPQIQGLELAAGYVPARQLGGDFYDFPAYGAGQGALAVGDVAGKGTAAALYGALAVGTLREHVAEHPCAPAEMLEQLNKHLYKPHFDGHFIAMAFGVYDPASRTLTLANAGFPQPLLVRNGRAEAIPAVGVPLGMLPDTRYEESTLGLEAGDIVVFCSDGVHESMNHREEEYGLTRLGRMVAELAQKTSAQGIAEGILSATERYAADTGGPSDDRTVVILKVPSPY